MTDALLIVSVVFSLASLVAAGAMLWMLLRLRAAAGASKPEELLRSLTMLEAELARVKESLARSEASTRAENAVQRQELAAGLNQQRTELTNSLTRLQGSLEQSFSRLGGAVSEQVQQLTASMNSATNAQRDSAQALRGEVTQRLDKLSDAQRLAGDVLRQTLNDQLTATRGEITTAVGAMSKDNGATLSGIAERVSTQLAHQGREARETVETLRTTVEVKLTGIQNAADAKLEQMRATVDEKLSATLNTRLGESFKMVSERLEAVQSGLGEMRSLAGNVTDLRRVLGNVKTRGVWGEVQLGNLLEQLFAPDQYETNFRPKPRGGEAVEFALRLPGPELGALAGGSPANSGSVYLPIDSKFPIEDFQRLVDAADRGDVDGVRDARKQLENRIYACAKDIRDKYINVPTTTGFAVLFLPTESLHAEVLKIPGLLEEITREYKVIVQGPSTFSAFAMALLMGFRTLAIQKRSADIANLLGAIKNDFGKFADLLGKVEEKLDDAKTNIGKARMRSNQIVRKLGKVEELPSEQARLLLPDPTADIDAEPLLIDERE